MKNLKIICERLDVPEDKVAVRLRSLAVRMPALLPEFPRGAGNWFFHVQVLFTLDYDR